MMEKILFIRHDKIGDFILTWPAFYILKKALPNTRIEVFVAPVMKSFALTCPYIDDVVVDSGDDTQLVEQIKANNYDAVIVSHSDLRIYRLVTKAAIPYKIAPNHGWFQYLYPHRANTQYKKGEPCWRGSYMLAEQFLNNHQISIPALPTQLWDVNSEREQWRKYYQQQNDEKLIFIHPGTGGSSGSLPVDHFGQLIKKIDKLTSLECRFVLTYNGDEKALALNIQSMLKKTKIKVELATPLKSLADFARSIVAADMFIAGSTGPLHIAGLHNIPTVGFYAGRRSQPKVKWQTLTEPAKRLAFTPPIGRRTGRNMALVDVDQAAEDISEFLNRHYAK
ncbi:glycosyltransferase family 9 protein [Shewanella sp. HL-SH4]|uniref:glycosyltransferase family 9 protein n=1 Tax=Shewanella sp. HL-SH4 TaxID=3436240 RepID=UPI003EC12977